MFKLLLLYAAFTAAHTYEGCRSIISDANGLHVPPLSYKSHENYVLFGKLSTCPLAVQLPLSFDLHYVIAVDDGVDAVLLNERLGDFMFTPPEDFVGNVTFWYHLENTDGTESSSPAMVTVDVQRLSVRPSLNVSQHIIGLEEGSIELDIAVDNAGDGRWGDPSVAICNCGHDVTCNRETGDCHCHLSLPDGWQIFEGQRRLTLAELMSLTPFLAGNLILRAGPSSAAEHCLAIHVVRPAFGDDPSVVKKQITLRIHPMHTTVVIPASTSNNNHGYHSSNPSHHHHHHHHHHQRRQKQHQQQDHQHEQQERHEQDCRDELPHSDNQPPMFTAATKQGTPFAFHDLHVLDMGRENGARGSGSMDGEDGVYLVSVELDHGGELWVRQDLREDVIFLPQTAEIHPEEISANQVYELKDRFGTFQSQGHPFQFEKTNNGVKLLRFIGSLEGINRVLSTLTYIPWCSEWPTPPSWPLPDGSWMDTSSVDPTSDPQHPNVWPPWYPRFWSPFPTRHWTWWPRVLPPWWMTTACSNWTSRVDLKVKAVPAVNCRPSEDRVMTKWSAEVSVTSSGESPKSLVTSNHVTYFEPDAKVFNIDSVYMRSLEYHLGMELHFNVTVLEENLATAEFTSTGLDHIDCQTIERCNDQLNIKVTFRDGVRDVCLVSLQIDMYAGDSAELGDRLVVWGMNTTQECIDGPGSSPDFELTAENRVLHIRQGSIDNELNLRSNMDSASPLNGILHVKIYAEHGLVTLQAPNGLRLYYDHMGQHGGRGIPTYLCLAGPVAMVMEALAAARFTPIVPLYRQTAVTVDYRIPSTGARLLYGEAKPFTRLQLTINVHGGILPYMPLILHPPKVCLEDRDSLPVTMVTVMRRFLEDESVTFGMMPERGSLQLSTQDRRANLEMTGPGMVIMHGLVDDINLNLQHGAVQYNPATCQDRNTHMYMDTISISVIPARNPEGDSVRASIHIHVTCASQSTQGVEEGEEGCAWGDWTPCLTGTHACGVGSQQRHKTCPTHRGGESRPCMNCSCSPLPTSISDPSPSMHECESAAPVPRCPRGCSVTSFHMRTVIFLCQPQPGTTNVKELTQRETDVQIHDSCFCDACSAYGQEE